MNRITKLGLFIITLVAAAACTGCSLPPALERSQQLQLDAMMQYRDEMASSHEKVRAQMLSEKLADLDAALAASMAQATNAQGQVPATVALARHEKRADLEKTYRANLDRLDAQFRMRQDNIDRAIQLGQATLRVLSDYNRFGSVVRSLFVRDVDTQQLLSEYLNERSSSHGGSTDEPQTSSR
jgi:hypothetical protein